MQLAPFTYKKRSWCLILLFFVSDTGCKKFVTINPPTTQTTTATVFSNSSTATTAMTSIYSQMVNQQYTYYYAYYLGLAADELTNYSTNFSATQFYANALNSTTSFSGNLWSAAYNLIYQANAVISGLNASTSIYPSIKNQLTGEALFTRAYWNFYLVNLFGEVPIVTTTDYATVSLLKRSPEAQVYQQIVADLISAQSLLNENYVDATDTAVTSLRIRPNKYAATALLARVYLYTGDFSDAVTQATAILNQTTLYSLDSLNGVFLIQSPEAIWQLQPANPGLNTPEGANFILTTNPQNGTQNASTISPQLLGAFEPGDNRRANWIDSIISGGTTYYFPFKYKVQSASSFTEYSVVLRLAEQYLIRAEANAQLNNLTAAQTDLNAIRSRAILPPTTATTQADLLTAIQHERQIEYFTEWGHRWLDMKRSQTINSIMGGPTGVCAAKNGIWAATDSLFPIPQSDRLNDPNLTQNQGY
ncbi:RagB/SusD family nutrient uptake outer membrane protein [Dinghuibacter silviterrae]|uniref:Putative outer membrane starch-binding protein n=1 Tax=Dinghuibacter silviterrae TaxID=1539049 RepID=A0A4R8DSV0_9BACT|nr:RagB/SusD family nutrient uptake outer membrane protein [Dinghuibacter silviterrae]TDX00477.1 putative outer membrane starch-binding protein [Dinghuibacter silviterrae]